MSQPRSFGTEISGNRQRNHEFTPEARAAILAWLSAGKSIKSTAREFNTTPSTVRGIKQRWNDDHTLHKRPRKGRPQILSETEKRYIIRMCKSDRRITWDALVNSTPTSVSRRTIRRTVSTFYKRKWKALRRPKLSEEHAAERLAFARDWIYRAEELVEV